MYGNRSPEINTASDPVVTEYFAIGNPFGRRTWAPADRGSDHQTPAYAARIMIVEDEYFVGLALEHAIISAGYEVVGLVFDAEEAVRLGGLSRPDLILMDIRLGGGGDGIMAATELYKRHGLRCLFVTAHSDDGTRTRALPARPLGWLAKPVTDAVLIEAVKSALSQKDQTAG